MKRLAVWLSLMPLLASAAGDDFLRRPRVNFDLEVRKIRIAYEAAMKKASDGYIKDLKSLARYMEKKGDDFGLRPTQNELKRFMKESSVPAESPLGTPELIVKARTRYFDVANVVEESRARKLKALAEPYLKKLGQLQPRLEQAGKAEELKILLTEIARVQSVAGMEGAEEVEAEIKLPGKFVKGLALVYLFDRAEGARIRDLSGRRRHGDILGGQQDEDKAYTFSGDNEMVEINNPTETAYWTVSLRVKFPLNRKKGERVLVSNGFRQHHVAVDGQGMLGLNNGSFVSSGYDTKSLRGWHEITAVGAYNGTLFFVDGKKAGACKAVCKEAVKAIGNSAAGARPWTGAIASAVLWRYSMKAGMVAEWAEQKLIR
ncbi:MAG: LamG-like jellyroll fold domain-containing protein [Verrucomicrobiota bacterium]